MLFVMLCYSYDDLVVRELRAKTIRGADVVHKNGEREVSQPVVIC